MCSCNVEKGVGVLLCRKGGRVCCFGNVAIVKGSVLMFEGECARVDVEKGSGCVCFEFWFPTITHTRMHAFPHV